MTVSISVTDAQVMTALRSFLLSIIPGIEVVRGQDNRVPEPAGPDFAVITSVSMVRLETDIVEYADTVFTGAIAGPTLSVSAVTYGALSVGSTVYGDTVAPGTVVTAMATGTTGGVGTYVVAPAQAITARKLAAGTRTFVAPTQGTTQVDFYGPSSAENVLTTVTLWRSIYSCEWFEATGLPVEPLFCSEPRQIVFINAEQQFETRWSVDVAMQINAQVLTPQQFADQLSVLATIEVQQTYPA